MFHHILEIYFCVFYLLHKLLLHSDVKDVVFQGVCHSVNNRAGKRHKNSLEHENAFCPVSKLVALSSRLFL